MFLDKYTEFPHKYFPAKKENYVSGKPVLTIIQDAFYNLPLVKQAIESILNQTYSNVELMLIDNGAVEDVALYLREVYETKENVSFVKFDKNVFSWNDPCINVSVCWNVGLSYCKGDYVSHLAYDDMMSPNYADKMVGLFLENPNCVTASPAIFSIDSNGKVNGNYIDKNLRGRFTKGLDLALDFLNGNPKKLFSAPGEIFSIRKEVLLREGGFDRNVDVSQLLKYAIFGDSGYDPEAKVFWRHHPTQVNKLSKARGEVFYQSLTKGWDESRILEIWESLFDEQTSSLVKKFKKNQISSTVYGIVEENVSDYRIIAILLSLKNVLKDCPQFFIPSCLIVLKGVLKFPFVFTSILLRKLKFTI
ncbi:glycosyltransferase [Leptospira limi]|uniref:Glycosyltransferase n=1 Tax=Leptospira limi TaxID=2950023 RepID=A0ABT3LZ29_9LEPT|nr:glycosyltransferase [Leptospira limi]MCW7462982.1 glycosyltransferase [Leptospira limi]